MKGRFLFCFLLLPLWCAAVEPYTPVIADPVLEPWRWRHEESLSDLGVLCMDEAEDGTLWFGNVDSIASYDGVTANKIPFDEELLSKITKAKATPWAKALLVLRDGNLLVLIGESLVLRQDDEWTVIIKDVGASVFTAQLTQSEDGTIWLIVPSALWRISEDLTDFSIAIAASGKNKLESFCQEMEGDLWVVERTGDVRSRLVQLPVENGRPKAASTWREFPVPFDNENVEARVVAGRDGLIWYVNGSEDSGLEAFDSSRGRWVSRENAAPPASYYSLLRSRDGSIWAGSGGTLLCLQGAGAEVVYPHTQPALPLVPFSLYEARNARLWVIGRIGHVYSVDLGSREWMTYVGLHFECETPDGVQWFVLQRNWVVSYDSRSGEWLKYGLEDGLIERTDVLIQSSHGLIWGAGEYNGRAAIAVFDGTRWIRFFHPEFARWIEPHAVFEAADGTIWFGAGGKMLADVPYAGGALQYAVDKEGGVRLLKHHGSPDFPYYVTSFSQTPEGTLWVGSTQIYRYDGSSPVAEPSLALQGENTVDMTLDQNQRLWVAKENFGVCQRQGDSWRVFTAKDGVASFLLSGLLALHDGSLLASSDKGISQFDGKDWTTYAYPEWFAMSTRWSSMRQSIDGSIWLNYVAEEAREQYIEVGESERYCTIRHRPETNAPDARIIDYLERVAQPGNNHITWSGHDLWSATPVGGLQYSWRLDEGEWSAFSHETGQTFLDLSSGRHVLDVRARDRALNVDPTPDRIKFTVIAPLWRQAWFISMISVFTGLILLLAWLLIRTRERHLEERQAEHEAFLIEQQEARERHLLEQQKLLVERQQEREVFLLKQQKDREQHLEEMDRLKTGFFTNISHELRTPMTVVFGRLQTILSSETDERKKSALSIVLRNAQRVTNLITQLLDFRKIEEGKIAIEATKGDLAPLLRDWMTSLQVLADRAKISLSLDCAEECCGWFDFDKMQKICTNLISNSIKYTRAGGQVHIILKEQPDDHDGYLLYFAVEDTGLGISQEHLEHIFDRFYRISEASMAQGAGIGLNLTKELVDLLGGEIRVESPLHPDVKRPGTRFTVRLPLVRKGLSAGSVENAETEPSAQDLVEESLESVSSVDPLPPSGHPDEDTLSVILVVEDDEDIRGFIVEGLESAYQVQTAVNGEVGLQLAKELVPDLIITDLMMPVMDGVALCRELKTSMETSHIPVVMLTAKASLEHQVEGLKTGADDYITKPFHMVLLQTRIANLLKSRRLLREKFCLDVPVLTPKLPEGTPDNEFLEKVMRVLEEQYSDWNFGFDEFDSALSMSRSTLRRKFKAVSGRTPGDFMNEFRMMKAAELLVGSAQSVAEITFLVGCEEPTNFSRLFKKYYSMSPSEYRETHFSS